MVFKGQLQSFLSDPLSYEELTAKVTIRETHISEVYLTDRWKNGFAKRPEDLEMDLTFVACMNCSSVNRVPAAKVDQHPNCGKCKSPLPIHGHLIDQNPAALQALIQAADRPVVVDFWAPWCGPCVSFAPTYQKVAQQLHPNFIFAKVNTEQFPQASQIYQVRGIPTLVVFDKGREKQRISGALPLPHFTQWLGQAQS